jgi:predicted metalloprotease with PDZ domain
MPLLGVAVVAVVLWYRAVAQLEQQNQSLRSMTNEVQRLRAENEDTKGVQAQAQELERLRKDNEEIHRLRNEVRQLREQKQEWEKQRAMPNPATAVVQGSPKAIPPAANAGVIAVPAGRRAWLGLFLENIPPVTNPDGSLVEERFGVLIREVAADSPGAKAGLKGGDIVIALDGQPVLTSQELHSQIQLRQPGQILTLDVVRDAANLRFQVTAGEREQR